MQSREDGEEEEDGEGWEDGEEEEDGGRVICYQGSRTNNK